ncbi:unnamed protein product [Tilletia controversa]|uniref:Uncharacterized protein n=1 Tax=Tilletia caries TaxID=13290 RepID=A0A8T8SIS7_9BASI|nr:hypothetical protein A4X03_0g8286 [Tilletia caries]CAD6902864.1 unnamed protein product [Tilletia controversa]
MVHHSQLDAGRGSLECRNGRDRLRAQASQNGDGDGGASVDQSQPARKGGHHKSALGGWIGSMASIAAHPMVLVLILAVNVLTIGTLAAGSNLRLS